MMYESAVEEKKDEIKNNTQDDNYRIATVTSLFEDGCPKLTFAGEEEESDKKYSYIYTYIPAVNDNVLLIKASNTYIILGKIAYNVAPYEPPTEQEYIDLIDQELENKKVMLPNDSAEYVLDSYIIKVNTAGYYSFFRLLDSSMLRTDRFAMNNQTPIYSQSVPSLSTSAELSDVITKVNTIISKLRSFGLFTT